MQTITAYRAADGTIFDNKEAAEAHDSKSSWKSRITDFTKVMGISHKQIGILGKYIPLWEEYKELTK
jgi:hypothetical protein